MGPTADTKRPNVATSTRARVRAELTEEIKQSARRQLAEKGAADLSLRAVARDLGMVSSAVYRYFSSRDELLTALIVDAYDALGETAEAADESCRRSDVKHRFRTVCRAAREWALLHPHEYGLLFGNPVPGYAAPTDTIEPAARLPLVIIRILVDAAEAGKLEVDDPVPVPAKLRADADRLRAEVAPDLPAVVMMRAIAAWPSIFGAITFELGGHFHNVIEDKALLFDYELERIAASLGLT